MPLLPWKEDGLERQKNIARTVDDLAVRLSETDAIVPSCNC